MALWLFGAGRESGVDGDGLLGRWGGGGVVVGVGALTRQRWASKSNSIRTLRNGNSSRAKYTTRPSMQA
ncbi:hypothetical protein C4E15_21800 [Achromobacter spanius]|uniref:Uncharacterized protein n=1 Tax=Achromobacter spanius TaxID=217203 RepID=A0A2S5GMC4_9BURK|nr:hypothetical protein C4E15_21800 [Achromobacter spanius]